MRRRVAALAAALALGPATALAQPPLTPGPVLNRYSINGCIDGATRYVAATGAFLAGRVVCFTGTAALSLTTSQGLVFPLFEGALTAEFGPEFEGGGVIFTSSSTIVFRADREPGGPPVGVGTFSLRPNNLDFYVGAPGPSAFSALGFTASAETFRYYDPETIRDVVALASLVYRLPGAPAGSQLSSAGGRLTFTPIPEPSTFALAAGGGVVLAAGALRRRRADLR